MATLAPGSTLTVLTGAGPFAGAGEGSHRFEVGDEARGRIRGSELSFDDLDVEVRRTGERSELVTAAGTPVLRFDPAGRKATTLTTSSARFRLARQRPRPLLRRWRLTHDVHGDVVLTVSQTPLGTRVRIADDATLSQPELAVLALGAVAEVLGLEPVGVPA